MREYDAVHIIGLWTFPTFVAGFLAKSFGIPYCVSLHGMLMPWAYQQNSKRKQVFMRLSEGRILKSASAVVCSSEIERAHFVELGISPRAVVVPNIVDVRKIVPQPNRFRERYGLRDVPVLMFAGRLVRNKGLHLSISAFAKIADQFAKAHFVIVGPDQDSSAREIQEQVRELGINQRVHFLGLLEGSDYWDALASADVFVLNSYSENFANTVAEAMAVGVPVIVSDQVGICDLVSEYKTGLVTTLDSENIAQAMTSLLSQKELRFEMGQNGIGLVRERFSPAVVGQTWIRLFEKMATQP